MTFFFLLVLSCDDYSTKPLQLTTNIAKHFLYIYIANIENIANHQNKIETNKQKKQLFFFKRQ